MKKLFAILMSIMMIACFMPTMAFAGGGDGNTIPGIELSAKHGKDDNLQSVENFSNAHEFQEETVDYTAAEKLEVTVTKKEGAKEGNITVELAEQKKDEVPASGDTAYFELNGLGDQGKLTFSSSEGTKAIGGTATFTVTPKTNLKAGSYTATVKLKQAADTSQAEGGETAAEKVTSFTVSFTVVGKPLKASDFTFTAPDPLIYDGSVKTVKVEAQGDAAVEGKIGAITVKYFKNNEGEGLEDASTDAGTYTVKISVAGGTDYAATDRKSTRLNSSHSGESRMPSSA